jgi:sugar fermentation stimulation protein A
MKLPDSLVPGVLIRRYQRFLADVELEDGRVVTAHCPNPGSMLGCLGLRWPVLLSPAARPGRKLAWTWELVHNGDCWIGVNTMRTNRVAEEGILGGVIPGLRGYAELRREVRCGSSHRIDLLLVGPHERCWVEVKSVTLLDAEGRYAFPDAVTRRGRRHLEVLRGRVEAGDRAAMLFVVQRGDGRGFAPAAHIDPAYAAELRRAQRSGVEVLCHRADVGPEEIVLAEPVAVELGGGA